VFQNSGTQAKPITLTNYPGEQVVLKLGSAAGGNDMFVCGGVYKGSPDVAKPEADYIHIIGTDVIRNIIGWSAKQEGDRPARGERRAIRRDIGDGLRLLGGSRADFVEMSSSIFTTKSTWQQNEVPVQTTGTSTIIGYTTFIERMGCTRRGITIGSKTMRSTR